MLQSVHFSCVPRDEARQRVCLDIIHKVIALLTPVQLQELLGAVTAFVRHPSPVCRERMYDILMWIQDNYRCLVGFHSHGTEISRSCDGYHQFNLIAFITPNFFRGSLILLHGTHAQPGTKLNFSNVLLIHCGREKKTE